jgi:hypothetical protein
MKKQTFLYQKESVFKACMKALGKNGYEIQQASTENGSLSAIRCSGFWDAKIALEIALEDLDFNRTGVNISVTISKQGILKKCNSEGLENQFIDMLYRCVNARSSYYMSLNEESQRLRLESAKARRTTSSSGTIREYAYELI